MAIGSSDRYGLGIAGGIVSCTAFAVIAGGCNNNDACLVGLAYDIQQCAASGLHTETHIDDIDLGAYAPIDCQNNIRYEGGPVMIKGLNRIYHRSANVMRSTSNSYSLLKLLKPQQGDWKLQVKGVSKDKIDINLVFNYDLELTMDPPSSSKVKAGDTIDINAYLVSNGQKLQNNELYGNMKAKLLVKDLDTGDESEVELENKGGSFEGSYKIPQKHDYELRVRAEEQSFYRESAPVKISAKAAAAGSGSGGNELTAGDEEKPFPLWPVIIGIAALLIVGAGAYFILGAIKKANKGFVGQIVIEIRDENTGEKTFPQYKKLTSFKGKFNLHQLLQLAPELKETEKILFTPGKNDRIMLRNNSSAVIEKSGRALDATKGTELKNGDRLRVSLQQADKTILFEYLA